MEEIEINILKIIHETDRAARSTDIANALELENRDTCDFLEMLEDQEYVELNRAVGGLYTARLTSKGRLLLTHPDYMLNKGYVDASDVLKALEIAVNDDADIPSEKKAPIIEKIREVYNDPYVQNISVGLIIEAIKKYFGL